jgi:hypothetical protein
MKLSTTALQKDKSNHQSQCSVDIQGVAIKEKSTLLKKSFCMLCPSKFFPPDVMHCSIQAFQAMQHPLKSFYTCFKLLCHICHACHITHAQARVIRRRHIFRQLLSRGCYLEDYQAQVGSWAARTSWVTRTTWRTSQVNGRVISCLGTMILCAMTLAVLLVMVGVEKNPGPGVEAEKILQVLCSRSDRNFNQELNVTYVDAGSITAVAILKLKWQRAENGSVISVDLGGRRIIKKKSRMLYFKFMI